MARSIDTVTVEVAWPYIPVVVSVFSYQLAGILKRIINIGTSIILNIVNLLGKFILLNIFNIPPYSTQL